MAREIGKTWFKIVLSREYKHNERILLIVNDQTIQNSRLNSRGQAQRIVNRGIRCHATGISFRWKLLIVVPRIENPCFLNLVTWFFYSLLRSKAMLHEFRCGFHGYYDDHSENLDIGNFYSQSSFSIYHSIWIEIWTENDSWRLLLSPNIWARNQSIILFHASQNMNNLSQMFVNYQILTCLLINTVRGEYCGLANQIYDSDC